MRKIALISTALLLTASTMLSACNNGATNKTNSDKPSEESGKSSEGDKETKTTEEGNASEGNKDENEFVTMNIFYPGDESDRFHDFIRNEFKERMKADLNMEVTVQFSPWDQYWAQKDIVLAAKEPVDLYWDGLPNLAQIVNEKQAMPLDELLAKYGQDLLKAIPQSHIDGGIINGKLYGIPSAYASSSGMYQFVTVREDLLKGVGMNKVETPEDLKEYAKLVKEKYPDTKGPADTIFKPLTRYYQPEPYTFTAKEELVVFGEETGKAYSYYETEAFQEVAKFNNSMFAEGLYQDELATNYNERTSRVQTGLYIWGEGSVGKDLEIGNIVKQNVPEAEMANYILAPEKPRFITSTGGEVMAIPVSSPNPEAAMRWLNWLFKNEDNYNFALYGVEGTDFTIEDGRLNRTSLNDFFYEWMFRNTDYQLFDKTVSDEYIETYKSWDDKAVNSKLLGFSFNNENVKEIEAAVLEAAGQNLAPIRDGFIDFEEGYEKAVQALKDAGMDEYVAEVQRQIDEFLANKG